MATDKKCADAEASAPVEPSVVLASYPAAHKTSFVQASVPAAHKSYGHVAGDILAWEASSNGKTWGLSKILKVDRVEIKAGSGIIILGNMVIPPADDFLIVVSQSIGHADYASLEEAKQAAKSNEWRVRVGHVPWRAPAGTGVLVAHHAVTDEELQGYRLWNAKFLKGQAGVW